MNTITRFNLGITLLVATMFFVGTNCSAQQRQGKGQGQPPIPDEAQVAKMVEDFENVDAWSDINYEYTSDSSSLELTATVYFSDYNTIENDGILP